MAKKVYRTLVARENPYTGLSMKEGATFETGVLSSADLQNGLDMGDIVPVSSDERPEIVDHTSDAEPEPAPRGLRR